jgi:hypothetical protein
LSCRDLFVPSLRSSCFAKSRTAFVSFPKLEINFRFRYPTGSNLLGKPALRDLQCVWRIPCFVPLLSAVEPSLTMSRGAYRPLWVLKCRICDAEQP